MWYCGNIKGRNAFDIRWFKHCNMKHLHVYEQNIGQTLVP